MPVVDPFSAASRPLPPQGLDQRPSEPLPFAATLHPIQLNHQTHPSHPPAPSTIYGKLPKPVYKKTQRKEEEAAVVYPSPQYSHSRHASTASLGGSIRGNMEGRRMSSTDIGVMDGVKRSEIVGSDEWMQRVVDDCVDKAKGDLMLKFVFSPFACY